MRSFHRVPTTLLASALLASALPGGPARGDERATLLVLDLDGDRPHLADRHYAVRVDVEGDGVGECIAWTAAGHNAAVVWVDQNGSRELDPGELLSARGRGTFSALERMDRPELGGNGDGVLSERDRSWAQLGLWIDRDRDGHPAPSELSRLRAWDLVAIDLAARDQFQIDGGLNLHTGWRSAWRRRKGGELIRMRLTEIGFEIFPGGCG